MNAAVFAVEFVEILCGLHDAGAAGGIDSVVVSLVFVEEAGIVPGIGAESDFTDMAGSRA